VNRIDRRIAKDLGIICCDCRNRETDCQATRGFLIASRDGYDLHGLDAPNAFQMHAAHEAGAKDRRFKWFHLECSSFRGFEISCLTCRLHPPGRARLLADHDAIEKSRGLGQAFFGRKQTIFVLDRKNVIVAKHPQG
jgi:hypothetical protein